MIAKGADCVNRVEGRIVAVYTNGYQVKWADKKNSFLPEKYLKKMGHYRAIEDF